MSIREELKSALFSLKKNTETFQELALEVFRFQYHENEIYKAYVEALGRKISTIDRVEKIPFLPIEFFKRFAIKTGKFESQMVFRSSGTTGIKNSHHHVADLPLYEAMSRKAFEQVYGPLTDYHIFALLPSYVERGGSSLVYMAQNFIFNSYAKRGGFFLKNIAEMVEKMEEAASLSDRKILLIGVTFGLLGLAENEDLRKRLAALAPRITIMETGGMKGRRKELVREELHLILADAFAVRHIHSEYGMTELLSQAYAPANGEFILPASMGILLREINDPFTYLPHFKVDKYQPKTPKTGGINVIDLCNIDSCSFIETQDLGMFTSDYQNFKVMGRFDNSDIRGCNLMIG